MKITLPYPPSLNRLYRTVGGKFLLSREGRRYKATIEKEFLQIKSTKINGDVAIDVDVFRPQKRGDLDNTLKALLDSLQGICYENDGQIVEIRARRFDDKKFPRVEVQITELV